MLDGLRVCRVDNEGIPGIAIKEDVSKVIPSAQDMEMLPRHDSSLLIFALFSFMGTFFLSIVLKAKMRQLFVVAGSRATLKSWVFKGIYKETKKRIKKKLGRLVNAFYG
jgi:hypothetical protein